MLSIILEREKGKAEDAEPQTFAEKLDAKIKREQGGKPSA
jgi:hypothetical protein